jgi:ELWxxDGT repeat protein
MGGQSATNNSSPRISALIGTFLAVGTPLAMLAQPARLILDIDTETALSNLAVSEIAAGSDRVLFSGWTPESGSELWTTDGTPGGTRLLVDLMPGPTNSSPTGLARVGNYTLFWAFAGGGDRELWRTDGTAEGTMRVHPPPDRLFGSQPFRFVEAGGIHYFTSRVGDGRAILWRTDGTAEATNFVADGVDGAFMPEGGLYVGVRDTLFFEALGGIWKTDGTRDGTVSVIPNPGRIRTMADFGGHLVFLADGIYPSRSLWTSDGTTSGTRVIKSWEGGERPADLLPLGGFLYFTACEPATGCELWRTDGTTMGTSLAAEISPGRDSGNPRQLLAGGARLYFFAEGPTSGIYAFDPVSKVVERLISLNIGNPYYLEMAPLDGMYVFRARGSFPIETTSATSALIVSDGTASGTRSINGPDGKPVFPTSNFSVRSRDVLVGLQVGDTWGLWSVDKATGTLRLVNRQIELTKGSDPSTFTSMNGFEYFQALEGPYSRRLWRTDGTSSNTSHVAEALPVTTSRDRNTMAVLRNRLYFNGCDEDHACELWSTDGTRAGTKIVIDMVPGPWSSSPSIVASSGDRIFFTAGHDTFYEVLWQSDGSTEGTRVFSDIVFPFLNVPESRRALVFRGTLLLPAFTASIGCGLAKADPRDGTITMLRAFTASEYLSPSACPSQLLEFKGQAFFTVAEDGSCCATVLWMTDGTADGTRPLLNQRGTRVPAQRLAATRTRLFFTVSLQLWRTDGSAEGTTLVKSLPRWRAESGPSFEMATVGETLFFTWSEAEHATELWKSDGTAEGTGLVKDIRPGALGSLPHALTAAGGRLYFAAWDGLNGAELWTSDGTEAGTVMVQDIAAGAAFSDPADLTASCGGLFFTADDGLVGREPWVLPIPNEAGRDPTCHRVVTGAPTGIPVRRRKE